MKVSELIKELMQFPAENEVAILTDEIAKDDSDDFFYPLAIKELTDADGYVKNGKKTFTKKIVMICTE